MSNLYDNGKSFNFSGRSDVAWTAFAAPHHQGTLYVRGGHETSPAVALTTLFSDQMNILPAECLVSPASDGTEVYDAVRYAFRVPSQRSRDYSRCGLAALEAYEDLRNSTESADSRYLPQVVAAFLPEDQLSRTVRPVWTLESGMTMTSEAWRQLDDPCGALAARQLGGQQTDANTVLPYQVLPQLTLTDFATDIA